MKTLLGLAAAAALPLHAENARLPYAAIYHMERIQGELAHTYTNLVVILRITPTVKTNSLQVYIDAKSGRIPVTVGPDGDFNVPLRDDLLADETWIVTNQPKGTMKLDWGLALAVDRVASPTRYGRLMKPVRDCEYVEARMREVLPTTAKINITGLKITFPSTAASPSVTIHSRTGLQKLGAGPQRDVIIPLNAAWLDEDPEISFSAPPEKQELIGD
ncbi:MAG TPA: hypothetical protein VHB20_19280 [Verrucomicrobiae bacterium]|nr:hypothetical protein [Verrucomicrobiae bacterium]